MTKTTIHKRYGIAGQVRYAVHRNTEHGEHRAVFAGSVHGTPGPIVMILMDGLQTHVDEPSRFGPIFNEKWVRRFYENPC